MTMAENRDSASVEGRTNAQREQAQEAPADAPSGLKEDPTESKNPVRRLTLLLLLAVILMFAWYVAADRVAPWTDQARVQAWIVPLAPEVGGRITKVMAVEDQLVKPGELLAVIDSEPYEIAVERAEAALELAGQAIGAGTAAANRAQASVVEAIVKLDDYEIQLARFESIAARDSGAVSTAQLDRARANRDRAIAQRTRAEAELERAKRQLGPDGENNPRIRDALAALRQARIDLSNTEIRAPSEGGITNQKIDQGYYAQAGVPVMTFVSFSEVWVQANIRENSIANIQPGDRVEMSLDTAPGRIFRGTVFSSGIAVQQPLATRVGEAHVIRSSGGWLRDAQRFPVLIDFDETIPRNLRRAGGQVDVQIYTQKSNWLLNGLGWLWIRLMSLLSYIY